MIALNAVVLVPTYNNERSLSTVLNKLLEYTDRIIVVNDGSTDATSEILKQFPTIRTIGYPVNKGKGFALKTGFSAAREQGFRYLISIDSDGQHYPEDLLSFLTKIEEHPDALLIGARNLQQENMPKKNSFGNKFSNFWFHLFTGIHLPDTQSGYRLYPIQKMAKLRLLSNRYELELEVLVRSAWKNIPVLPVNVRVFYAEAEERVSHFRPGKDFTRISILNTLLFFPALIWFRPKRLILSINKKNIRHFFKKHFLNTDESPLRKSLAVAFGVFMGIIPIWGYQFVSALLLAHLLKLNKAIVGVAANISIPPMIPLLLFGSLKTGQLVLGRNINDNLFNQPINFSTIQQHLFEYIVGSFVFAVFMALVIGLLSFFLIRANAGRRLKKENTAR